MFNRLWRGIIVLIIGVLVWPTAVHAQTSLKDRLQAAADKAVTDGLPGVSIAVRDSKGDFTLVVAGKSDLKANTPLTTTDISRIASASKVFVGTVVLQLIQEKKIALTDPIANYIRAENAHHIANADRATIAQLLTHSSGIFDYYDQDFGLDVPSKMDFTIDEALKYAWDKPALFEPGAKYSYSNTDTLLLGEMIEQVTGMGVAQAIRTRILTPLNLKNTYTEVFETVPVKIIRGYAFDKKGNSTEIGDKYPGGGLPDGGIVTTPKDMVIFMHALFAEGKLLDTPTLQAMITPQVPTDDGGSIGYHIFIDDSAHGKMYSHDGGIDGYSSIMMYFPDSDVTIALWTNGSGRKADKAWANLDIVGLVFAH